MSFISVLTNILFIYSAFKRIFLGKLLCRETCFTHSINRKQGIYDIGSSTISKSTYDSRTWYDDGGNFLILEDIDFAYF